MWLSDGYKQPRESAEEPCEGHPVDDSRLPEALILLHVRSRTCEKAWTKAEPLTNGGEHAYASHGDDEAGAYLVMRLVCVIPAHIAALERGVGTFLNKPYKETVQRQVTSQWPSQKGTYTGACSMTMTQGVAVRFRLVVMSFLNLRHTSNNLGQHLGWPASSVCREYKLHRWEPPAKGTSPTALPPGAPFVLGRILVPVDVVVEDDGVHLPVFEGAASQTNQSIAAYHELHDETWPQPQQVYTCDTVAA